MKAREARKGMVFRSPAKRLEVIDHVEMRNDGLISIRFEPVKIDDVKAPLEMVWTLAPETDIPTPIAQYI